MMLNDEDVCKLLESAQHILVSVFLFGSQFSGEHLAGHLKLTKLKSLQLPWCIHLSDVGLCNLLNKCGLELESLDLYYSKITGAALVGLDVKLTKLKYLNLSGCSNLTDSGLRNLLNNCGSQLESLDLSYTYISGTALVGLDVKLTKFKNLNLSGCSNLTDSGLRNLLKNWGSQLESLDLDITKISGTELTDCIQTHALEELRVLRLVRCPNVNETDVQRMSNVLPISCAIFITILKNEDDIPSDHCTFDQANIKNLAIMCKIPLQPTLNCMDTDSIHKILLPALR